MSDAPEPEQPQPQADAQSNASEPANRENKPTGPKNDRFYQLWDKFASRPPAPKNSVLPSLDVDTENHPGHHPHRNRKGVISSENAVISYDEAAATCKSKVKAIINECRRLNKKYYDPLFNLATYDTLASLAPGENPDSVNETSGVGAVKRIEDIFDKPRFIVDGATANDVRQGRAGDCWFLAAVTALSGTEEIGQTRRLLTKLCVARDEKVGVYGFVFHRDGEWISEVVDDRLCLRHTGDHKQFICRIPYDKQLGNMTLSSSNFDPIPQGIKDTLNRGSNALYFSSCRDSDETWLPLLEKAFAKAHGDYQSIESGLSGEGIEDMTGGVNSSMDSEDVLDKDILWGELLRVNKDFLFGCSSRRGTDESPADAEGFVRGHAYTVLEAKEVTLHNKKKERLLKIRNPWGRQEWNGAWSDGSKEWTPELMKDLGHTFGDDGIFWISFKDFLKYYPRMDRTRLFGSEWTISQQWTSVNVQHHIDYSDTKFSITFEKAGPAVIVLAQPDSRYFAGLEGRYRYQLHYRLYRDGEDTYIVRSMGESGTGRSCSAELDVEVGTYTVIMKITASRTDAADTPEDVIRRYRRSRKEKLLAVGKSYDMTHSKGLLREKENENADRRTAETMKAEKTRRVTLMKAERAYNREALRKSKLKMQRIKMEMQKKLAAKRSKTQVVAANENVVNGENAEDEDDDEDEEEETVDGNKEDDQDDDDAEDENSQEEAGDEKTEEQVEEIEPPQPDEDDAVSDIMEEDLDWDSDIDDPVDPIVIPPDDRSEDVFTDDPWNAVCVVALRVYSLDANVKVQAIEG